MWYFLSKITQMKKKRYIFVFSLKCITGFKHKYPYIEFNSKNPKKKWVIENERVCQADIDVLRLDDSACNRN